MKKALAVVIGILAVLAIGQAQEAEDPKASVEKLIQEGLEAYKAGKNQEAILKLQKAIGLIQQSAAKGLEAFLPAAPDGWKADPAKSKSGNWGAGEAAVTWTQASCRYIRESDNLKVEVTISDSPQIIQGQKALPEPADAPDDEPGSQQEDRAHRHGRLEGLEDHGQGQAPADADDGDLPERHGHDRGARR
ncbi:MAG: hypothetical protein ACYTG3_20200 [Planctomycetota bacterium]|jgi:hypothetical protein